MKKHKRKVGRMRGKRTHGAGCSKNRRGTGSRMTNKRTFGTNYAHVLKFQPERINLSGFTSLHRKGAAINLRDVARLSQEKEIDVTKHGYSKVIGGGKLARPLTIRAPLFSKGAKEKIEAAGGRAVVIGEKSGEAVGPKGV
jgi:large subunit ribosomal protein L15